MAEQQEGKPRRTAEQLRSQLVEAVKEGDLEELKKIVNELGVENGEREKLLNSLVDEDCTLLHIAAENNEVSIINWLLSDAEGEGRSQGFNQVLAKTSDDEQTALHVSMEYVSQDCFLAIVNGLRVDNGERQEMLNAVNARDYTLLHQAVRWQHVPIISWILSEEGGRAAGFDRILSRARNGQIALHIAAQNADLSRFLAIVDGLRVDNGERQEMLNAVDNDGLTILHVAVDFNCEEIVSWILSEEGGRTAGFNSVLAKTGDDELTALHYAVQSYFLSTPRTLLSHCTSEERMNLFLAGNKQGWSALHYAARGDKADMISHLLSFPECGLIVNMKDNRGMTALHRAIVGGIDEESRCEWTPYVFRPDGKTVSALLGLDSSSTTTTTKAWIDPNIGLGLL